MICLMFMHTFFFPDALLQFDNGYLWHLLTDVCDVPIDLINTGGVTCEACKRVAGADRES